MCDSHSVAASGRLQKLMMILYGKWVDDTLGFYTLLGKTGRIPFLGVPVRFFAGQYGKYVHGGRAATVDESLEVLAAAEKVTVMDCSCRVKYQKCDGPIRTCIGINTGAEVLGSVKKENPVSKEEAESIIRESYERGLIRTIIRCVTPESYVICNCCTCCCVPHRLRSEYKIRNAVDNGYKVARLHPENCGECMACTRVCPGAAILPGQGSVDPDKCLGCGLCVGACPSAALEMVDRPPAAEVPAGKGVRILTYISFYSIILPMAAVYKLGRRLMPG